MSESIVRVANGAAQPHSMALKAVVNVLTGKLGAPAVGPESKYPIADWLEALTRCMEAIHEALDWLHILPKPKTGTHGSDPVSWATHDAYKFLQRLSGVEEDLRSQHWQLANASAVLLTGPAGIGKSHLLADVVEHQVHLGRPAILVLGSSFRDDEPWRQIQAQLDRPPTEQTKHFLGSLDAAAEASGTRALVCVDAQ